MTRGRFSTMLAACAFALAGSLLATPALAADRGPTGETILGQSAIEPAYDDVTGKLVYLLTPIKSPFPTHTSSHAVAPLYLVEYPASSSVLSQVNLNCMGVPGNCPDHDGIVAAVATGAEPGVYGTNPNAVPGHDHLVGIASSHEDFNVAWEVIEVVFTNSAAANTHLVTAAQVEAAEASQDVIEIDLGFAFHCSVVSAAAYNAGTSV